MKLHPIFKEPVYSIDNPVDEGDGNEKKEITSLSIFRHRLDPNSMKVLFKVLEGCPQIQTLK
jgi:hypothetical protein